VCMRVMPPGSFRFRRCRPTRCGQARPLACI